MEKLIEELIIKDGFGMNSPLGNLITFVNISNKQNEIYDSLIRLDYSVRESINNYVMVAELDNTFIESFFRNDNLMYVIGFNFIEYFSNLSEELKYNFILRFPNRIKDLSPICNCCSWLEGSLYSHIIQNTFQNYDLNIILEDSIGKIKLKYHTVNLSANYFNYSKEEIKERDLYFNFLENGFLKNYFKLVNTRTLSTREIIEIANIYEILNQKEEFKIILKENLENYKKYVKIFMENSL